MAVKVFVLLTVATTATASPLRNSARIPLKLDGANCADPDPSLPKYCCDGIIPNKAYWKTCECNPGWDIKECTCKGLMQSGQMPCHHCMVHLPGTNRWEKVFSKKELYDNCEDCVEKCKAEDKEGYCKEFMDGIYAAHFPDQEPV